jgi:hypothetical protein
VSRLSYWQNDFRIDPPRAIRRHTRPIAVLPTNVIVMPKRPTRRDGG